MIDATSAKVVDKADLDLILFRLNNDANLAGLERAHNGLKLAASGRGNREARLELTSQLLVCLKTELVLGAVVDQVAQRRVINKSIAVGRNFLFLRRKLWEDPVGRDVFLDAKRRVRL